MTAHLRFWVIALALLAVLSFHDVAAGCPTCKNGMAGDPAHSSMVQGYFWSIVFLMSMPFLILGGVSAYFYFEIRRARVRLAACQAAEQENALKMGPQVNVDSEPTPDLPEMVSSV